MAKTKKISAKKKLAISKKTNLTKIKKPAVQKISGKTFSCKENLVKKIFTPQSR